MSVKAWEGVEELNRELKVIREEAANNVEDNQKQRKKAYDQKVNIREFKKGSIKLTRVPGLTNKLDEHMRGCMRCLMYTCGDWVA